MNKEEAIRLYRKGVITAEEAIAFLKDAGATDAEINASSLPLERIAIKADFRVKLSRLRVELTEKLRALDGVATIEDDEARTQALDDINMEAEDFMSSCR